LGSRTLICRLPFFFPTRAAEKTENDLPFHPFFFPILKKKNTKRQRHTQKKGLFFFNLILSISLLSLSVLRLLITNEQGKKKKKLLNAPSFFSLLHRRLDQQASDGVGVDVGGGAPVLEVALLRELDREGDADRRAAVGDARPKRG